MLEKKNQRANVRMETVLIHLLWRELLALFSSLVSNSTLSMTTLGTAGEDPVDLSTGCSHTGTAMKSRTVSLLPRFFCSSVSVGNNTRMRKGGEKRGRPGIIHHVPYVKWT